MARRLSSILSLGSNASDQSSYSNGSRPLSSFNPERPAKELSDAQLARKSTPDLRLSTLASSLQDGRSLQAPRPPPPVDTSRLSPQVGPLNTAPLPALVEDGDPLSPPFLRKPLPQQRDGSPLGSRPVSRGSAGRPGSRAPSRDGSAPHSRAASPSKFRPTTPTSGDGSKLSKRMSWLPGRGRSESQGASDSIPGNSSWIATPQPQDKTPYDLGPLINFEKIPELWNDACDTYVYLHARECGRGASFKIDSSLFASSRKLAAAAYGGLPSNHNRRVSQEQQHRSLLERTSNLRLNASTTPPGSQRGSSNRSSSTGGRSTNDFLEDGTSQRKPDIHLCIPLPLQANLADPMAKLSHNDVEVLVALRNVFAFLAGQPLVATSRRPSIFAIFLEIADVLHRYEFTNLDGSTLGEESYVGFSHYVTDFRIADVRASREKTIEAVVLGERMKHWPLYNEGFVHAIGKYEDIVGLHSPKFSLITEITCKRMERANFDLRNRLRSVRDRLNDFDFPSLFAGIAISKTSVDSKGIRFKLWKSAFGELRGHVISFYKGRYGAWPPKARSKKNDFEESGLNRVLLRELYTDFSDLYDALVDRNSMTTRHAEVPSEAAVEDSAQEPTPRALRRLLEEYDRSTPPVQPPMPFDTPRLPSLATTRGDFAKLDHRKQKKESMKKIQTSEINLALMKSYNREHGRDPVKSTPFIDAFTTFERRCARGKSIEEIADIRIGQWIFMYTVLQALPLVVVDAPDLKFTQGVEYLLCEVPKGSPPWVQESFQQKQSWYGISGGSGLVSLPADIVEHGVDGIYRRSHCWTVAEKWAGPDPVVDGGEYVEDQSYYPDQSHHQDANQYPYSAQYQDPNRWQNSNHQQPPLDYGELQPPVIPGSRPSSSGSSRSPRRMSMASGLEQLPLPQGMSPSGSRPVSTFDPNMSFDKILGAGALEEKKGKTKKK